MSKETLTIIDNRTGREYEFPLIDGNLRTADLRQIKTDPDDFGLMTYDPAFMNTASCQSAITFIDGDKGILRYRGYPIEQLAEKCTFLEVAYLMLFGELPTAAQLNGWTNEITHHTMLHETTQEVPGGLSLRCPPHGHVHQHRCRALHDLYGRPHISDPEMRLCISPPDRRRCRRLPPTHTATASAFPTSIRTTTSATPKTS